MSGATGTGGGARRLAVTRAGVLFFVALAVIAADQATKSWALSALAAGPHHIIGPVYLVLTLNSGAAFSLGAGSTPIVETVALLIVCVVLWHSGRLARSGGPTVMMAVLGLLTGGALSNLADRVLRGHHGAVVDFIQLVSWWPVFNVADAAITVGAICLVGTLMWPGRSRSGPHEPVQEGRDNE
ncbi:MAG TPA: signal peptidase II [Acidimicrobiales bacterium]|nr:signal peptidase II [Acidimicrobiales bacterium]